jgi:hypothetical protein
MKTIIAAVDPHLGRKRAATVLVQTPLQVLFDEFDGGCKGLASRLLKKALAADRRP